MIQILIIPGCQSSIWLWNNNTDWFSQPILRLSPLQQIVRDYRKKCNKKPWISWSQPFHLNHCLAVKTASGDTLEGIKICVSLKEVGTFFWFSEFEMQIIKNCRAASVKNKLKRVVMQILLRYIGRKEDWSSSHYDTGPEAIFTDTKFVNYDPAFHQRCPFHLYFNLISIKWSRWTILLCHWLCKICM